MTRTGIPFYFILSFVLLLSCSDDEQPACPAPVGEMIAHVNDTIVWDFRYVTFTPWSDTEFASQWADSSVYIRAEFVNAGCVQELSLDLHNIGQTLDRQPLVKRIQETDHPSLLQPHSIFFTWNVDVLTERFELYEGEPAWIQLSEVSDEKLSGVFQGTYVYRPSASRFWILPDTLRFNEVAFEAHVFVSASE